MLPQKLPCAAGVLGFITGLLPLVPTQRATHEATSASSETDADNVADSTPDSTATIRRGIPTGSIQPAGTHHGYFDLDPGPDHTYGAETTEPGSKAQEALPP